MTKMKNYAFKDWIVFNAIIKHSFKILVYGQVVKISCQYKESEWG